MKFDTIPLLLAIVFFYFGLWGFGLVFLFLFIAWVMAD